MYGNPPTPVLLGRRTRVAVATLLLLVSIPCALAGWWTLDRLFVPARLAMLLLLLALTPVVIGPVLTGQWAARRAGVVQCGASAVIALLYAVLASAALLRALDTRASQQTLGTPSGEVAGWLIAAAAAVAGLASLAAALPLPLRRTEPVKSNETLGVRI